MCTYLILQQILHNTGGVSNSMKATAAKLGTTITMYPTDRLLTGAATFRLTKALFEKKALGLIRALALFGSPTL